MLAECFGKLFEYGHRKGLPISGWPLARYVQMGPGLLTVEAAMPIAIAGDGEGEMQADTLPGGSLVVGIHAGPYEQLPQSWAEIERWMESGGHSGAGAPWESYVTDPAAHPDPSDWRTEVIWPVAQISR
jgi:AraC family transcriptional regulator